MPQIDPTTSATSQSSSAGAPPQSDPLLSKDAFLQLLMVQLEHQDPLNAGDPSQYVAQLAQYTTMEQETNIAASTATAAAEQNTSTALSLLGHTVTYTDSTGATQTGAVTAVDFTASGPTITVGGVSGIDPTTVDEVT